MATFTETTRAGEFILSDASGRESYDKVTIAAGGGLMVAGTVLGMVAATGKYKLHDNQTPAADGTQNASAILLEDCDATADVNVTAVSRIAEVKGSLLTWRPTISGPNKILGIAQLASNSHIIVR
jgi:hypothetical protein